jgi:integrase
MVQLFTRGPTAQGYSEYKELGTSRRASRQTTSPSRRRRKHGHPEAEKRHPGTANRAVHPAERTKSFLKFRSSKFSIGSNGFEHFCARRSKFRAAALETADIIEYQRSWTDITTSLSRRKRVFVTFIGRDDLLSVAKAPKLSEADHVRLEPQSFSEDAIRAILNTATELFPGADGARLQLLIRFQLSTGLAIRDAVQIQRSSLSDGWLRIKRQKTGRDVV